MSDSDAINKLYLILAALGVSGQQVRDDLEWGLKWIAEEQVKKEANQEMLFSKIEVAVKRWGEFNTHRPVITISSDLAELCPPTTKCVMPNKTVVDFTSFYQEDKLLPLDTVVCK